MDGLIPLMCGAFKKTKTRRNYEYLSSGAAEYSCDHLPKFQNDRGGGGQHRRYVSAAGDFAKEGHNNSPAIIGRSNSIVIPGGEGGGASRKQQQMVRFRSHRRLFSCEGSEELLLPRVVPTIRTLIEESQMFRMGDEMINTVIRHGGRMDFSGSVPKKVGGEENVVDFDTDYLSYRTLIACMKEDIGYHYVHRMWWLPLKKTMATALRELFRDMKILYCLMIDVNFFFSKGNVIMFFEATEKVSGGWDNEDDNLRDDEVIKGDDDIGVENSVQPLYPEFIIVSERRRELSELIVIAQERRLNYNVPWNRVSLRVGPHGGQWLLQLVQRSLWATG
ncbi:hypothetical protein LINPERHAP1_LOCUS38719 [Linum perenne]